MLFNVGNEMFIVAVCIEVTNIAASPNGSLDSSLDQLNGICDRATLGQVFLRVPVAAALAEPWQRQPATKNVCKNQRLQLQFSSS